MPVRTSNQQHPPLPKKKRTDSKGNEYKRVFAKSGNATLMVAKGLTPNAALVFTQKMGEVAEKLGGNIACDFIITNGK